MLRQSESSLPRKLVEHLMLQFTLYLNSMQTIQRKYCRFKKPKDRGTDRQTERLIGSQTKRKNANNYKKLRQGG